MSKIMRQLYAEARASREAKEAGSVEIAVPVETCSMPAGFGSEDTAEFLAAMTVRPWTSDLFLKWVNSVRERFGSSGRFTATWAELHRAQKAVEAL